MPVSANTLFHFTDGIDNLINILTYNFRPHYSLEDFKLISSGPSSERFEKGIPIVAFCDIPLSSIKDHAHNYGKYAIGMTKEWGKAKGVCPVLYTYPGSQTAKLVFDLIKKYNEVKQDDKKTAFNLFCLLKPYEGNLWKGKRVKRDVTFYNEREWRYVAYNIEKTMSKAEYCDTSVRKRMNKDIFDLNQIDFSPKDIRYLIVKNEAEILPFIRKVEDLKGSKYSYEEVKILITRIMSYENIEKDI